MKPADAEFVMGDRTSTEHKLGEPVLRNGWLSIECSCGWRVSTSREMAPALAQHHIQREVRLR